jgi:epoxyqueuosine reductase
VGGRTADADELGEMMARGTTDVQKRTEDLQTTLLEAGACLVGFADLACLDTRQTRGYTTGICFALEYGLEAVDALPHDEPFLTRGALLSQRAHRLYALVASFLDRHGYRHARVSSGLPREELPDLREELPQKTLATLAGLGWIGKSSLLVSPQYGPRVRLGAMLTDAPLQVGIPVTRGNCGDCTCCIEACPAGAIKGRNWLQGLDRADLLDVRLCGDHLREGIATTGRRAVCGLCLKACPLARI